MTGVYVDDSEAQAKLDTMLKVSGAGMRLLIQESGDDLRRSWAANATATAGEHGVHYPASIESHMSFGGFSAVAEVGPNPGRPQGGMSFEYGSVNQPPHLDGKRALDALMPVLERRLAQLALFS